MKIELKRIFMSVWRILQAEEGEKTAVDDVYAPSMVSDKNATTEKRKSRPEQLRLDHKAH